MLLFTHCTGIFISHCTSYNAKGDINNNTLLLQDRWLHCGHSGPLPLRFLFFLCSQFIQRKQPSWIPHTVLFFLFFLFFFFCSFFKMQVERRAFNGLSTIPDSPAWNFSMNFLWKWTKCLQPLGGNLFVLFCFFLKRLLNRWCDFKYFFFFWKERKNRWWWIRCKKKACVKKQTNKKWVSEDVNWRWTTRKIWRTPVRSRSSVWWRWLWWICHKCVDTITSESQNDWKPFVHQVGSV